MTRDIEKMVGQTPEALMIERGLEGWAFILKETEQNSLEEVEEKFSRILTTALDAHGELEYFGGLGDAGGTSERAEI